MGGPISGAGGGDGGVDTTFQVAPNTGWTALTGAPTNGSASIASGVITLTTTAAQTEARLYRESPSSPFAPSIEMVAQITRTITPASGAHWQNIVLGNQTNTQGYLLQVDDGGLTIAYYSSGSWTQISSAGVLSAWSGGQLWLRVVVSPGFASFFQGAGATLPTSWTFLVARSTASPDMRDVYGAGLFTHLHLGQGRAGGGSGNFTCTARNVQWRSLLGVPE